MLSQLVGALVEVGASMACNVLPRDRGDARLFVEGRTRSEDECEVGSWFPDAADKVGSWDAVIFERNVRAAGVGANPAECKEHSCELRGYVGRVASATVAGVARIAVDWSAKIGKVGKRRC